MTFQEMVAQVAAAGGTGATVTGSVVFWRDTVGSWSARLAPKAEVQVVLQMRLLHGAGEAKLVSGCSASVPDAMWDIYGKLGALGAQFSEAATSVLNSTHGSK